MHRTAWLIAALLTPALAAAQSVDDALAGFDNLPAGDTATVDEVLQGFGDTPEVESDTSFAPARSWALTGAFSASAVYIYGDAPVVGDADLRGLERLRTKLNLQFDQRLSEAWDLRLGGYAFRDFAYTINDRDDYVDEVVQEMETDTELGEAWVRGRLGRHADIKLGRQIVVWGKSDNLRVTDVINPLDAREPGIVDIEDLRLPLTMTRLDLYAGPWNLGLMAIHEIRFDKRPAYGSPFYPAPVPMPAERTPSDAGPHTEYAAALNGIFSGWDLSFYAARVYDDQPYPSRSEGSPTLEHERTTMVGSAANLAFGNWLLKGEMAHFDDIRYSDTLSRRRTDVLLGMEYAGIRNASLGVEVADRHIHDYVETIAADEDTLQTAVRYQHDLMHDTLHVTALSSVVNAGSGGGFTRATLAYDIRDALTGTVGAVIYHGGDTRPFDTIGDNDLLFGEIKYSF